MQIESARIICLNEWISSYSYILVSLDLEIYTNTIPQYFALYLVLASKDGHGNSTISYLIKRKN